MEVVRDVLHDWHVHFEIYINVQQWIRLKYISN